MGKNLCQSLFFNKVAGIRPATLFKERLWHNCFPMDLEKFFRQFFYRTPVVTGSVYTSCTPFYKNPSEGLLLFHKYFMTFGSFTQSLEIEQLYLFNLWTNSLSALYLFRNSHSQMFYEMSALKNFSKFMVKHLHRSPVLRNFQDYFFYRATLTSRLVGLRKRNRTKFSCIDTLSIKVVVNTILMLVIWFRFSLVFIFLCLFWNMTYYILFLAPQIGLLLNF